MGEDVAQAMILSPIPQSLTHKKLTKIDALLVSNQFVDVFYVALTALKPLKNSLYFNRNNTQILSQLLSNTLLAVKNILTYWITNLPKKFINSCVIKYSENKI